MQYIHRPAFRSLARLLAASSLPVLAIALAGCDSEDLSSVSARALRPLPAALAAEIDKRNMPREAPILVRIFKEESELEVWKQNAEGKYALLKTYPVCRWSGELGPKVRIGDRQAPEGFYNITPALMNPNSNYYLAFNLGFPNAYDRANDRSGEFLMVHGDCSSAGCYAMTDEQIQEIYALGRDAFLGGQKAFQVQAYPFRMTALNMARHRNNPNMAFWRMLKEGNDHFEVTRAEPRVDVCEKRYVFDARAPGNASAAPAFQARDKCPAYEVSEPIATAVKAKAANDERAFAEYAGRGIATAAVRTGTDGGMHPLFLAKLQGRQGFDLQALTSGSDVKVPSGPLPPTVNPPRAVAEPQVAAVTPAPPPSVQRSEAAAGAPTIDTLSRWLGLHGGEAAPPPAAPVTTAAATPAPKPRAKAAAKPKAAESAAPPAAAAPPTAAQH